MNSHDDRLAPWIHAVCTALTVVAAFGAVLAWTFYPSYRDDKRVEAAVKELQVTASTDPWAASERLTTLLDEIRQGCSRYCDSGVIKDAYATRLAWRIKAVENGQRDAIVGVLTGDLQLGEQALLAARDRSLKMVERASKDGELLLAVGQAFADGVLVVRDMERADSLFHQAFAAGAADAANTAAVMWAAAGNKQRALAWSLRCVLPCKRVPKQFGGVFVHTDLRTLAS